MLVVAAVVLGTGCQDEDGFEVGYRVLYGYTVGIMSM